MLHFPAISFAIIESDLCVVEREVTVERTWKERLFSLPWRPLRTTKVVVERHPDPMLRMLGDGIIVCHPAVAFQLRAEFMERPDA